MAYTPELSDQGSAALRRIAWALDKPMTSALEMVIEYIGRKVRVQRICLKCRDKSKCTTCLFAQKS